MIYVSYLFKLFISFIWFPKRIIVVIQVVRKIQKLFYLFSNPICFKILPLRFFQIVKWELKMGEIELIRMYGYDEEWVLWGFEEVGWLKA